MRYIYGGYARRRLCWSIWLDLPQRRQWSLPRFPPTQTSAASAETDSEYPTLINVSALKPKQRLTILTDKTTTLCLRKKRHPFYFCDIFVRLHPISLMFGRNIPQEI